MQWTCQRLSIALLDLGVLERMRRLCWRPCSLSSRRKHGDSCKMTTIPCQQAVPQLLHGLVPVCRCQDVARCGNFLLFCVVGLYWDTGTPLTPPQLLNLLYPVVICCNAYNVLQFTQWLPTLAAQVFRPDFFGALIQVVEPKLGSCKDVEVTNLLWACAQLVKHQAPEDGPGVGRPLSALMDAVEVYFQGRLQEMQSQILVSALVSVAMLSAVGNLSLTSLFSSICDALALKSSELSLNNKTQLGVAGRIMTKYHEQVVQAVCKSFSEKCPELATYFRVWFLQFNALDIHTAGGGRHCESVI